MNNVDYPLDPSLFSLDSSISVLITVNGEYIFGTRCLDLVEDIEFKETYKDFKCDLSSFDVYDVKQRNLRTLNYSDIKYTVLVSHSKEFSPVVTPSEVYTSKSERLLERIRQGRSINNFTYSNFVDESTSSVVCEFLSNNKLIEYYDFVGDNIEEKFILFDKNVTEYFLNTNKDKIFDSKGNVKLTFGAAAILSFFDRQTHTYILSEDNKDVRLKNLKILFNYLIESKKDDYIVFLKDKKTALSCDLDVLEKNYISKQIDEEIDTVKKTDYSENFKYISFDDDIVALWPFEVDLSNEKVLITRNSDANAGIERKKVTSLYDTSFFNLYKVFTHYVNKKYDMITFKYFCHHPKSNDTVLIKEEIKNNKLKAFETKKQEILAFLNEEYNTTTNEDVKNDINNLKNDINTSIDEFLLLYKNTMPMDELLKAWPLFLYPIPEHLVVN